MKWCISIAVKVLFIISVCAVPAVEAQPHLTLFPESAPIEDNASPQDLDPQVDVIVVENIPVPGTNNQLEFSGEVRWGQTVKPTGRIENIKISITKATIKNMSATQYQLPADATVNIVSKDHTIHWAGKGVVGQVGFEGELVSGTLSTPSPKLTLSLFDSGVDFVKPNRIKLDATWMLPPGAQPPGPWTMIASNSGNGTTTTGPSTMMLWLSDIIIGGNQTMEFPSSIAAELSSEAIPAVSPWILGVLVVFLAATGGVFITRRHRTLAR